MELMSKVSTPPAYILLLSRDLFARCAQIGTLNVDQRQHHYTRRDDRSLKKELIVVPLAVFM